MKNLIRKTKDWIEDRLRRICAPMSPDTRILVIVILVAVFAITNFYVVFRAIYNIGREDNKWELIDSKIKVPEIEMGHDETDEEPEELQREMEKFFYEHFNSEQNDTTANE